jgi:hypothetical protein
MNNELVLEQKSGIACILMSPVISAARISAIY